MVSASFLCQFILQSSLSTLHYLVTNFYPVRYLHSLLVVHMSQGSTKEEETSEDIIYIK